MSKFDEKAYYERYPRHVDRFANQHAFFDFVEATHHCHGLRARYKDNLITFDKAMPDLSVVINSEVMDKITIAWAMWDTNGYADFLRVWVVLPDDKQKMKVYRGETEVDFWEQMQDDFTVTTVGPKIYKIEKIHE